ncbi:hypothetical protein [Vulcanisaeta distributa]|uniref:hypothetical protein n=1 Tax=Vulcanisaeta distributa TaxID=164451 RepID=UPI000A9911D3|nr:hypothetical protein [Vulcanisaeta distributa]
MELTWIDKAVEDIRSLPIGCAVAAISGGVDSTTAAVLIRRQSVIDLGPYS